MPFLDTGALAALASTLAEPYNQPEFMPTDAVILRTQYEGDTWRYVAARLGARINGTYQYVGLWALMDDGPVFGVRIHVESDGDPGFDGDISADNAFTQPAETGPLHWNDDRTKIADCAVALPVSKEVQTEMTLAQYEQLQPSQTTIRDLTALVGERVCEESTVSELGGLRTVGLTCRGAGEPGANAILLFQNDLLVSKSQAGMR